MKLRIVLPSLLFALASLAPAQNLITNGNFETGNTNGWTFTPAGSGSSLTVGNNTPFGFGSFSVRFGATGSQNDILSQTIATSPGQFYTLSLYLFVSGPTPPTTPINDYSIVFNGVPLIFATNANSGGGTFNFIPIMATGNFTTLSVSARNANGAGTFLDNVVLTAVPEGGSSAILLACGLAGLFVARGRSVRA
jgi:hypothetical protein